MAAIVAIGAVSPLGMGEAAWSNGAIGERARCAIARDALLERAGLRKPFAARTMGVHLAPAEGVDPAKQMLLASLLQIEPGLRAGARLGVAIGTSSGGMASAERLYASDGTFGPELARDATYHAPFQAVLDRIRSLGHRVERAVHPLTACSASTLALGLGLRWIEAGICDQVIAGGYDVLTVFVAAGFEALGATTAAPPPRPFRKGRDGMSLGEGCALFLLAPGDDPAALAHIVGFGASGDAVHLTAPDRTGGGLARSAQRAIADAGIAASTIDLVSVHGTSTPFNDPMEAKAIAAVLARPTVPVVASKATIGHTLGAAGALETALVVDALGRGIIPATAGEGELDIEVGAAPRERNEAARVRAALKLSAAFGGANAALVITRADLLTIARSVTSPRAVRVVAHVEVGSGVDVAELSARSGIPRERLARMDLTAHLALSAVSALAEKVGRDRLRGAGVVLGTALATLDVNDAFAEGMRRKGAAFAEGRRFAYTTPNASAGECAMAFALTGPNVAVGRGVDAAVEAREVASDLLAAGDAERVVVIDLEPCGPVTARLSQITGMNANFGARATLLEV